MKTRCERRHCKANDAGICKSNDNNSCPDRIESIGNDFKQYRRVAIAEMRDYVDGEDMAGISVSEPDAAMTSLVGGFVARNPANHADQWYIAAEYAYANFEPAIPKKQ